MIEVITVCGLPGSRGNAEQRLLESKDQGRIHDLLQRLVSTNSHYRIHGNVAIVALSWQNDYLKIVIIKIDLFSNNICRQFTSYYLFLSSYFKINPEEKRC